jgi:hypothetical protein
LDSSGGSHSASSIAGAGGLSTISDAMPSFVSPMSKQQSLKSMSKSTSSDIGVLGSGGGLGMAGMLKSSVSTSSLVSQGHTHTHTHPQGHGQGHGKGQGGDLRQQRRSTSGAVEAVAVSDEFESFIASRSVWNDSESASNSNSQSAEAGSSVNRVGLASSKSNG